MKRPRWTSVVVVCFALGFQGVFAPATFFVKHTSADDFEDTPSPPPKSTAVAAHRIDVNPRTKTTSVADFVSVSHLHPSPTGTAASSSAFQERLYPGTTYNEDFGAYSDTPLTGFSDDITDFPTLPQQGDRSKERFGPTAYQVESGEPPDYQTFYTSDEDTEEQPPPRPTASDEHRDYNEVDDDDDENPLNYEVEEKIPDDLKYKPPKVKVFPLPPPCKGATPPPWPTNPPPPKPPPKKPTKKPVPKKPGGGGGGSTGFYVTNYGNPYYRTPTRATTRYRKVPAGRYLSSGKPRSNMAYRTSPVLIRYASGPGGPVIVRLRTVRPVQHRLPTRTSTYRRPTYTNKRPTSNKQKEIIKEVHIHHHHDISPPMPHPFILPLIPLFDENGLPVSRDGAGSTSFTSPGAGPFETAHGVSTYGQGMTSYGTGPGIAPYGNGAGITQYGGARFAPSAAGRVIRPIGMTSSGSDNVGTALPVPDGTSNIGHFAEPPPHTTSTYVTPTTIS